MISCRILTAGEPLYKGQNWIFESYQDRLPEAAEGMAKTPCFFQRPIEYNTIVFIYEDGTREHLVIAI